ncbi:MAG: VTT domain-containing protein [Caldilineaceae bacterium]
MSQESSVSAPQPIQDAILPLNASADAQVDPLWLYKLKWWGGVFFIVAITVGSFWLLLNPAWVAWAGQWGYVGAFLISLISSATIILPAPGIAVVVAMGNALDPVTLGIVAGVGSAFGELSGYIAGATGSALIPPSQRIHMRRLQVLTRKYGALLLLVLAAIPFPLFDLAGMVAGALRMRVIWFFSAVAVGKSIKYIILIFVGLGSIQLLQHLFATIAAP